MDAAETSTEVVNRASDCCRLCRSPGNLVKCLPKIYSESNREGSLGYVIALMCQNIKSAWATLVLEK